jgi:hypothetical protein
LTCQGLLSIFGYIWHVWGRICIFLWLIEWSFLLCYIHRYHNISLLDEAKTPPYYSSVPHKTASKFFNWLPKISYKLDDRDESATFLYFNSIFDYHYFEKEFQIQLLIV